MARIMKIHREPMTLRKHNEKHRFYDISKFSKMFIFEFFLENKEILKFINK